MYENRHRNGAHLPHTLLLQLLLERQVAGKLALIEWIERIVVGIDAFCEKFRDGTAYTLCSADQLRREKETVPRIMRTLAQATRIEGASMTFVSRKELAAGFKGEEDALTAAFGGDRGQARSLLDGTVNMRQMDLFSLAMGGSLRHHLPEARRGAECHDDGGRSLDNIMGLSLGTRWLLDSLDAGFGRPLAHVFKDDIVALWSSVCVALLDGDVARVAVLLKLAEETRCVFPIALLSPGVNHPLSFAVVSEPCWLMMTD